MFEMAFLQLFQIQHCPWAASSAPPPPPHVGMFSPTHSKSGRLCPWGQNLQMKAKMIACLFADLVLLLYGGVLLLFFPPFVIYFSCQGQRKRWQSWAKFRAEMINEKHYVKGKRKIAKLGVLPGKEGVQLGAGDKSQAKGISSLEFLRLRQW